MSFKKLLNTIADDSNLRGLTQEESEKLKRILLDNYLYVQDVCEKNGLSVMLVGGSALGAIRHKGYIPWDDDFDIAMPRKDYNKFKDIFEEELGDRYKLDAPNSGTKSSNRFPKILIKNTRLVELGMNVNDENACIKIDLFIIENAPSNIIVRFLHGLLCSMVMYIAGRVDSFEEQNEQLKEYMYKTKEGRKAFNRRARIGKLFSFREAYKWFDTVDKVCQWKKEGKLMGIPTGRKHYFGELLPRNAFVPASQGIFENHNVNLPGDTDMYLNNLFGDYMRIPDEKDREKHFIYDIKF